MLQSANSYTGLLPVTDVYGKQYFYTPRFTQYPYNRTLSTTTSRGAAGICVGSGTTSARVTDFDLESQHTSGISLSLSSWTMGVDGSDGVDGSTLATHLVTVTNTSSSQKTVSEIGMKQPVATVPTPGGNWGTETTMYALFDRTIIEPAITLGPGEAAVIRYTLRSDSGTDTVSGVKCVSWQFGSDEDVAAMIDAAQEGTIDLHDVGWEVGDTRAVALSEVRSGGSLVHPAQTVELTITSFEDYESCGCVMQLDFCVQSQTTKRMGDSQSNAGGYAASEMCTTTLPLLAQSFPQWLSERMLEFDVTASDGTPQGIETITGNKLALRSEVEVRGTATSSHEGEGTPVQWYSTADKMRQKRTSYASTSTGEWWLRSASASNATSFVTVNTSGGFTSEYANRTYGVAPFLCV